MPPKHGRRSAAEAAAAAAPAPAPVEGPASAPAVVPAVAPAPVAAVPSPTGPLPSAPAPAAAPTASFLDDDDDDWFGAAKSPVQPQPSQTPAAPPAPPAAPLAAPPTAPPAPAPAAELDPLAALFSDEDDEPAPSTAAPTASQVASPTGVAPPSVTPSVPLSDAPAARSAAPSPAAVPTNDELAVQLRQELLSLEADLTASMLQVSSAEHEAAVARQDAADAVAAIARKNDAVRAEAEQKRSADTAYYAERIAATRASTEAEIGAMRTEVGDMERKRHREKLARLLHDQAAAEAAVVDAGHLRDLLIADGTIEGVAASVLDAPTPEAKLDAAARCALVYARDARRGVAQRLGATFRGTLRTVASERWDARTTTRLEAKEQRAAVLASQREESAARAVASLQSVREAREARVAEYRAQLQAQAAQQRAQLEATAAAMVESTSAIFREAAEQYRREYDISATNAATYAARCRDNDAAVHETSVRDATQRHQLERKVLQDVHVSDERALERLKEAEANAAFGPDSPAALSSLCTQSQLADSVAGLSERVAALAVREKVAAPDGHLELLCQEREVVVQELHATLRGQMAQAGQEQHRLQHCLDRLGAHYEAQTAAHASARSAALRGIDAVVHARRRWEEEHRAMLADFSWAAAGRPVEAVVLSAQAGGVEQPSPAATTPAAALLGTLTEPLTAAVGAVAGLQSGWAARRDHVASVFSQLRATDDTWMAAAASTDGATERLLASVGRVLEAQGDLLGRADALSVEAGRLAAEQTVLERDRDTFAASTAELESRSAALQAEAAAAAKDESSARALLQEAEARREALVVQQGVLVRQQRAATAERQRLHDEQRALDAARVRLCGPAARGAQRRGPAAGAAPVAALQPVSLNVQGPKPAHSPGHSPGLAPSDGSAASPMPHSTTDSSRHSRRPQPSAEPFREPLPRTARMPGVSTVALHRDPLSVSAAYEADVSHAR